MRKASELDVERSIILNRLDHLEAWDAWRVSQVDFLGEISSTADQCARLGQAIGPLVNRVRPHPHSSCTVTVPSLLACGVPGGAENSRLPGRRPREWCDRGPSFKRAWHERDYGLTIKVAERLSAPVLQEDAGLLMYYDNALMRAELGMEQGRLL